MTACALWRTCVQKRQRNIFKTHPETENGDPSSRMPCIVHMLPENCTTMVAVQVIHTVKANLSLFSGVARRTREKL